MFSWLDEGCRATRHDNPELGERAGLRIDLYKPAMLLDDDVVTDGQAKPRSLANGLGGEEWTKQLGLYLGRNAGAIVANPDFDAVTEVFGRSSKDRLIIGPIRVRFALGGGIEAV